MPRELARGGDILRADSYYYELPRPTSFTASAFNS